MNYNSKLDLRSDAIRLAVALEDVTSDNVVDTAKAIEAYIAGDAKLPEVYDQAEEQRRMMELTQRQFQLNPQGNEEKANKEAGTETESAGGEGVAE